MAEEQILLIQLRQLGDILLTTPCIKAVKKARPKARIAVLSHAMGQLILDQSPYVDEHFFYRGDATKGEEWRLAKTLRQRGYDLVIDFMNNPRSAFYTLMTGGKERVSYQSARWPAYNTRIPRPTGGAYIVDEKFELLRAAGITTTTPDIHFSTQSGHQFDRQLDLPWFEVHTKPLMQFWSQQPALKNAALRVVLSPTHRREPRRWPLSSYAALADRLVREWGAEVIWLWGPGEETEIDRVMSLCHVKTYKAPATNFREMAALIANCDLFIGNSNGPSHVAVAARICSLQLHGPTRAASWCPQTEQHASIQSPDPAGVIDAIGVGQVIGQLEQMRPTLETFASQRRQAGLRLSWRDL